MTTPTTVTATTNPYHDLRAEPAPYPPQYIVQSQVWKRSYNGKGWHIQHSIAFDRLDRARDEAQERIDESHVNVRIVTITGTPTPPEVPQ